MQPNSTADRIIYVSIAALMIFGLVSFFYAPLYEKGGWVVINALVSALSACLGFKFGITQSQSDEKPADGKPAPPQP